MTVVEVCISDPSGRLIAKRPEQWVHPGALSAFCLLMIMTGLFVDLNIFLWSLDESKVSLDSLKQLGTLFGVFALACYLSFGDFKLRRFMHDFDQSMVDATTWQERLKEKQGAVSRMVLNSGVMLIGATLLFGFLFIQNRTSFENFCWHLLLISMMSVMTGKWFSSYLSLSRLCKQPAESVVLRKVRNP